MTSSQRILRKPKSPAQIALYRRGISRTQLAAELDITTSFLQDLITGQRGAKSLHEYAPRIAEATGIPIEELFPDLVVEES